MAQAIPLAAAAVGGLLGGRLISKALKKKEEPAPEPVAAQPTVMPTPDDSAIMRARRRATIQQVSRRGRESTMLTPASSKLGG